MRASRPHSHPERPSVAIRRTAALLLLLAIMLQPVQGTPRTAAAQSPGDGRLYPQTGHTLDAAFLHFYDSHGGVPLFGYPISESRMEGGYLVQWTERQRLEYHPENAGTEFEVLLGRLGAELTRGFQGPRFSGADAGAGAGQVSAQQLAPESHFFEETGHTVSSPFLDYWRERGGVRVFGYPISEQFDEGGLQVQWFERARFEIHPENAPDTRVLLGFLGYEALKDGDLEPYTVQISPDPAPDTNLEIGLAQGGESEDPGFFDNIRQLGRRLSDEQPAIVRIDNIFNYYGIYHPGTPGPDGLPGPPTYDFSRFDRVLDGISAMGMEPLICLSYMPEEMSVSGHSRVEPPADYAQWGALVAATVKHVNVDRKLGVRYWEVWNEPDQWSFWQGSYVQYLRLYDTTVAAIQSVDPTAKIGGPGIARFSTDHLDELLQHEAALGDKAKLDFISWHSYGRTPDETAWNIRRIREIIAMYPSLNPQIFITEFSVLQGGPGDTSANGYTDTVEGAIAFLSSIESMERERLDRALLFELKDGEGPEPFWGRWGVLTYDGQPKPAFYALEAYRQRPSGALPVTLKQGRTDGSLGVMAYGSPSHSTIMVWYTGEKGARVKIDLPPSFAGTEFDVALFDKSQNNPAATGKSSLQAEHGRSAGDLVLDMAPNSLAIITR